MYNWIFITG